MKTTRLTRAPHEFSLTEAPKNALLDLTFAKNHSAQMFDEDINDAFLN